MTKEVTIKIKGKQHYPEGENLETVTESIGEYYLRNDSHYVMYEEKEAGFTESSKCMLKIRNNTVELTKKGLIQSRMVFEEGRLHMTEYRTPFGMVMLGVQTKHVRVLEEDNALAVQIEYGLEADEAHMADCNIQISIRSKV